ncbi:glycine betaine uptake BCCT transporter [Aneurinibacillus aneurinilyticus]|uniref:glycine betaine uptake BCCT transporter n=1 Tax=Aneurinibacillus aneurinilyticus TaxID=1391 RepID=UPI0023F83C6B|nr:BCCT family transporter [Aneurinibacillus aneurinilyticus]MCI1692854.1 BCCT family transporter [Aneurinibacillus aneurinilyticus]
MANKKAVFYISLCVSLVFIVFGVFMPEKLGAFSSSFLSLTYDNFGWLYLTSVFVFFLFCTYLAFSKFGKIRLGDDTDRPEYKTASWLAMLFSAAIGISLMFWGVAEPVYYYVTPPLGKGGTPEAAGQAIQYVYFHWGVSGWACYALVGVCLAYFQFRKKQPALMSSAFYPVLGEKVKGPIGKTIDILAVLATVFGVTTSLGLGTMQISNGLHYLWGVPDTQTVQFIIIMVVTVLYLTSAISGLDKGIKILSNTNMLLAFTIMGLILVFGPTKEIFKIFFNGVGSYIQNFIGMTFRLEPFRQDTWIANWTLFYWGWWIAWSPLVGSFIARISKGRTIKEFMIGVLFVPVVGSFFWFAVFGGSALHFVHNLGNTAFADAVTQDVTSALFKFFEFFPFSSVLSVLAVALIGIFFITSADSAIFVLGMLSEDGNQNPANRTKIIWGLIIAVVAMILLASGGLKGLQSVSVAAALPFSFVMLYMCYSMYKGLHSESMALAQNEEEKKVKKGA